MGAAIFELTSSPSVVSVSPADTFRGEKINRNIEVGNFRWFWIITIYSMNNYSMNSALWLKILVWNDKEQINEAKDTGYWQIEVRQRKLLMIEMKNGIWKIANIDSTICIHVKNCFCHVGWIWELFFCEFYNMDMIINFRPQALCYFSNAYININE